MEVSGTSPGDLWIYGIDPVGLLALWVNGTGPVGVRDRPCGCEEGIDPVGRRDR